MHGKARATSFAGTDRFVVEAKLGEGAMGVVFRADDRERGHHVALKTLVGLDPDALYLFKQEFRALAGVTHRNLVALYELVSNEDRWFFTMELICGSGFLDYLRGQAPSAATETILGDP